jgi:predicted SnoaL-like aldol condensation-catalyzing enzyme
VDETRHSRRPDDVNAPAEPERPPNFDFSVTRVLQDGDAMFVKAVHEPDGSAASWLTMSLICADSNGPMSVRRQISARYLQQDCMCSSLAACSLPNGSREETAGSKAVVQQFIDEVVRGQQLKNLDDFLDRSVFVSHTPGGCSHPDRLAQLVARRRPRPGLRYHGVDDLVGEGRFVALFSCFDTEGVHFRACDLFRLAGGRIVEHWDVVEQVSAHTVAHNDET